ncbi:stromal membrane-associated protein 2 [Platysternon megacephalum]|uniref:Stromal membrane-associated protein 2 n=1 Tax=Platysternon megacephalum TaxID=55544 RepID=A0A4D9F693_9SAUR|nr:stromal membrane-associated protein 2 [Platysternon megacephalum]
MLIKMESFSMVYQKLHESTNLLMLNFAKLHRHHLHPFLITIFNSKLVLHLCTCTTIKKYYIHRARVPENFNWMLNGKNRNTALCVPFDGIQAFQDLLCGRTKFGSNLRIPTLGTLVE